MNKIENNSDRYYQNSAGMIQDGREWNIELKDGHIRIDDFNSLEEVYWSSMTQAWVLI
jgi:hypothetical protein